jgi:hypothetical protein
MMTTKKNLLRAGAATPAIATMTKDQPLEDGPVLVRPGEVIRVGDLRHRVMMVAPTIKAPPTTT